MIEIRYFYEKIKFFTIENAVSIWDNFYVLFRISVINRYSVFARRKNVIGLSSSKVAEFSNWPKFFSSTLVLRSTQPLTEKNNRNPPGG
jgi:hypothetical protein